MQIAYRESITCPVTETSSLEKTIGNTRHSVSLSLTVRPQLEEKSVATSKRLPFVVVPKKDSEFEERQLKRHHIKAIENGIISGLSRGIIYNIE